MNNLNFTISSYEKDLINNFQKQHTQKHLVPGGTAPVQYQYTFSPTPIGTIGQVSCCLCNNKYRFRSLKQNEV